MAIHLGREGKPLDIEQRRQDGRPACTLQEAAELLKVDARAVRKMIEAGDLDGGVEERAKNRSWYVYADQPAMTARSRANAGTPAPDEAGQREKIDEQAAEINRLRGQLRAQQQRHYLLLAATSALSEASDSYRDAASLALDIVKDSQAVLDKALRAAAGFQMSADKCRQAAAHYRDILAEMSIPDDIADLDLS